MILQHLQEVFSNTFKVAGNFKCSAQQISANSPTVCVQLVTVYLVANGTAAVFPMKRKDIIRCQDPKFMLPQSFRSREGLVSKAIQGVFGGEWANGCGWPT